MDGKKRGESCTLTKVHIRYYSLLHYCFVGASSPDLAGIEVGHWCRNL